MKFAVMIGLVAVIPTDSTSIKLRDGQLFLQTGKLNLIRGPLLNRLKSGNSVAYDFHLALMVGDKSALRRRSFERFVVSYDLWEEKFAVTNLRKPRASASGLTPQAVDAWCLDRIGVAANGIVNNNIWVKLEVRAVDPKQDAAPFTIQALIEALNRPAGRDEQRWSVDAGPVQVTP